HGGGAGAAQGGARRRRGRRRRNAGGSGRGRHPAAMNAPVPVRVPVPVCVAVFALSSVALAEPRWSVTVHAEDLAPGQLAIAWVAHDLPPDTTAVCVDMANAGKHLHDLRLGERALAADPDDCDCFPLPQPARDVALSYRYDLGALAKAERDPDLA